MGPFFALKSHHSFIPFFVLTLAIGYLGSLVTAPAIPTWYAALIKPPLTPPDWVFAPVWTALYVMMAVAAWLVWRAGRGEARRQLTLYAIQLALNLLWSVLFFGLKAPGAAAIEIVVLLAFIAATAYGFGRWSRPARLLMLPYLAWVGFAAYLTFGIWWLN